MYKKDFLMMKIMILEILVQINLEQQMLNLQEVSVSAWGQLKIPFIYEKEDVLCCMCRTDEANQIVGPFFAAFTAPQGQKCVTVSFVRWAAPV